MDTIDRQAALNCFHAWVGKYGDIHEPDEMPEYRAIEELPTVEPERKKGKWVVDDEQIHVELTYHCSECGFQAWGEHEKTDYCGGCGADMRG